MYLWLKIRMTKEHYASCMRLIRQLFSSYSRSLSISFHLHWTDWNQSSLFYWKCGKQWRRIFSQHVVCSDKRKSRWDTFHRQNQVKFPFYSLTFIDECKISGFNDCWCKTRTLRSINSGTGEGDGKKNTWYVHVFFRQKSQKKNQKNSMQTSSIRCKMFVDA